MFQPFRYDGRRYDSRPEEVARSCTKSAHITAQRPTPDRRPAHSGRLSFGVRRNERVKNIDTRVYIHTHFALFPFF